LSNGDLVESKEFAANVEGTSLNTGFSGNTAVVLTVVLAIIFVVLLVVLIVLLTRKPQKTQEFGESYY
jgi:preprotein translocase subunit SecG